MFAVVCLVLILATLSHSQAARCGAEDMKTLKSTYPDIETQAISCVKLIASTTNAAKQEKLACTGDCRKMLEAYSTLSCTTAGGYTGKQVLEKCNASGHSAGVRIISSSMALVFISGALALMI